MKPKDILRKKYTNLLMELLKDEQIMQVGSNKLAFPVVDSEGNEEFIEITVKVPTGSNKGTEIYDGYALAEEYQMKLEEKTRKAKEKAEQKAKKIERDKKIRMQKQALSEKRETKE